MADERRQRRDTDQTRSYFRAPLAAIGGALVVAGVVTFVVMALIDITAGTENPYRGLITFFGAPAIIVIGAVMFLISVRLQIRKAHKEGEKVKFSFSISPYDPRYRRNLVFFMMLSFLLIAGVAYSGYRGYEVTDSVAFCGETCHEVMEPQAVTYHNSAHARVPCVECHIGPGASFWVKAKFDGVRQVFATMRNSYSRPIETPVHNLRPAQETCEECHWPQQFYGQKMVTHTYYRTDEDNSPYTVKMLVKIGGGNPRTGRLEGIHWHMLGNKVEYIATDEKRQDIVWVRVTDEDGRQDIFTKDGYEVPDTVDVNTEARLFDCMDCHNRPSHKFQPPATGMNLAISTRRISPEIPYVREVGLDLLNAEYETKPEALRDIKEGLWEYYLEEYPEWTEENRPLLDQAVVTLQTLYDQNFFPEMNTDYRARENNLSHFVNDGCFRCHAGDMENAEGVTISHDCASCHTIVAQGPHENVDSLTSDISGLEFVHPEDIDGMEKEYKCTECHTPEQGY